MRYYIAQCQECRPVLPLPFAEQGKRDGWASTHSDFTGHAVTIRTEDREENNHAEH